MEYVDSYTEIDIIICARCETEIDPYDQEVFPSYPNYTMNSDLEYLCMECANVD
jgi:DNA-directed RNA polymerase subunit RPC12/RpoP